MFPKMPLIGLTVLLACLVGCNGNNTTPSPLSDNQPPLISQHETGGIVSDLSMPTKKLYWKVNELRAKNGLRPLKLKAELCAMAQRHVADMIEQGQISHLSPAGLKIDGRLEAEGIHWTVCAENVGRFRPSKNLAKTIIDDWLTISDDRANLLNELCLDTGLAVVEDERTGKWYVTQIFLRQTLFWGK